MTALLWCDKMYKNISKKLLHLTIEFFLGDGQAEIGLTMKTYEWKQMLGRIETEETDDGTKE